MGLLRSWLMSRQRFQVCHPGILCEPLEERIVLDASAAPANQNQTNHIDQVQTTDAQQTAVAPVPDQSHPAAAPDAASHGTDSLTQVMQRDLHVVLVSDALDHLQGISNAANEGTRVAVISEVGDNLASVNQLLGDLVAATGQKIGELAILSHGTEGLFTLGSDHISAFNLSDFRAGFEQLSTLMTADAQIQLYACSVAGNDLGKALVDGLALYTGADIFASTDSTGGSVGNWTLEYTSSSNVTMNSTLNTDLLTSLDVSLAAPYPAYQNNWGVSMGGVFYFVNDDGVHGKELWAVTANGEPWMVKDINPGSAGSNPSELTVYNNGAGDVLYFSATDGNNPTSSSGVELWRSDGTEAGTYLVKDINPGGNHDSNPRWLTVSNGLLYFSASDGTGAGSHGNELWRSDGTLAGTSWVADINPGQADSNPSHLTDVNGTLYFSATDGNSGGAHGNELWKSDGTQSGTVMVMDINPGNLGSNPDHLINANGTLFFSATDGTSATDHGNELWKSNASGTSIVMDINPGNLGSNPAGLIYANGVVFFSASDGNSALSHGTELWRSDGTPAGTSMVADINPGQADSNPSNLTYINGTLYFSATDGNSATAHGNELWMSDGTEVSLVKDIYPGPASSSPTFFNNYNGQLMFAADDGVHGYELWKHDNTTGETFLLKDISASGSSFPLNFGRLNPLFFLADDGSGFKLWKSDGTVEGTVKVSDVSTGSMVDTANGVGNGSAPPGAGGGQSLTPSSLSLFLDSGPAIDASSLAEIIGNKAQYVSLSEIIGENFVPSVGKYGNSGIEHGTHSGNLGSKAAQTESGSHGSLLSSASPGSPDNESSALNVNPEAQDQDFRPPKWDQPFPGMIKVVVLENGDYSVRTDLFALVVGAEVWNPPMVRWYLSALSEGRYRPGSLPSGFERMIWDFLQYSAGRKSEGQSPLTEVESKLAWQWAEWRRQLAKVRGSVDVLPWEYFKGLSKAMILFYGGERTGDIDLAQAVNALQQNIRNLTIIPIKLPDELLSRAAEEPPSR